jgi:hypothetical protein
MGWVLASQSPGYRAEASHPVFKNTPTPFYLSMGYPFFRGRIAFVQ